MRITLLVQGASRLYGKSYLICENRKIDLYDDNQVEYIDIDESREYEIILINNHTRKFIWYVLLWIGNLVISPINILLMNVDSDWHKRVKPNIQWRCNCFFKEDTTINIQISNYSGEKTNQRYDIQLTEVQNGDVNYVYQEEYKRGSLSWEANKYLSKFFSFELCGFIMLYFIFRTVSFSGWKLVVVIIGFFFLLLFGSVVVYTVRQERKLWEKLRERVKCS